MSNYKKDKSYIKQRLEYVSPVDYISELEGKIEYLEYLKNENERLNNIIDEFNEWLIGEKMMFYKSNNGERLIRYEETKSKWLEEKQKNSDK